MLDLDKEIAKEILLKALDTGVVTGMNIGNEAAAIGEAYKTILDYVANRQLEE